MPETGVISSCHGNAVEDRNFAWIAEPVNGISAATTSGDNNARIRNPISPAAHVDRIARIGEIDCFLERTERSR